MDRKAIHKSFNIQLNEEQARILCCVVDNFLSSGSSPDWLNRDEINFINNFLTNFNKVRLD